MGRGDLKLALGVAESHPLSPLLPPTAPWPTPYCSPNLLTGRDCQALGSILAGLLFDLWGRVFCPHLEVETMSSSILMADHRLPVSELFLQAWHTRPHFLPWPLVWGQPPWAGPLLISILPLHGSHWVCLLASSPGLQPLPV